MSTLKVTLKASHIGCSQKQKATLRGLGLTRREKTVEVQDTPAFRGMIKKVLHLVEVSGLTN